MGEINEMDDLTPEEIKAVKDYYAGGEKIRFDTVEEFIKWLDGDR